MSGGLGGTVARAARAAGACGVAVGLLAAFSPPSLAAVPPVANGAVRGVDVSAFQHGNGADIDWRALYRGGIRFAAVKLTEGTYYANPYYASDVRAARAAGLSVLPYVFANPRSSSGAAQAAFAVRSACCRMARMRRPLVVDLENDPYAAKRHAGNCYGLRPARMVDWIAAFTGRVMALTGKRPVIYTTADWWRQCARNTALFRQDPLWVADYGVARPAVPSPWKTWTFWQYTDSAVVPGIGHADLDYFRP
jgi:lysozyme